MKMWRMLIIFICLIISLISGTPRRRKSDTTHKFHTSGEAIAVDNLIQQFESEHQQFYKGETRENDHLKWPALDNKNLSKYCRQYLQHILPARTTDSATGTKIIRKLRYQKLNTSITREIIIVQCKHRYKTHRSAYYITRASEPNCVYALKYTGDWKYNTHVIIHKHCDFEDSTLINRSLKWKKMEIIDRIIRGTGQPVAKDKYLVKYELEHQGMFNKEGGEKGKFNPWPHAMEHPNLNTYCYQYLKECCPDRNREGVTGSLKTDKLHYEKLNTYEDNVITVTCVLHTASQNRFYYMTRAPENNCVYALHQMSRKAHKSLAIIFKHCDFEDSSKDVQIILNTNIIPKTEVNE